jgi:hypothetical protein
MAYLRISALRRADSSKRTQRTPRVDRESSKWRPDRFQPGTEPIEEPDSGSEPALRPVHLSSRRTSSWNGTRPFDRGRSIEGTLAAASDASTRSLAGRVPVSYRPQRIKSR